MVEHIRAFGGNITREAGPVQGGTTVIAFVKDPDGYTFALIQRSVFVDPFVQISLRVGDLERDIKFYEKVTNYPKHVVSVSGFCFMPCCTGILLCAFDMCQELGLIVIIVDSFC